MAAILIKAGAVTVGMKVLDANQLTRTVVAVTDADGVRSIELDGGAPPISVALDRMGRCPVLQVE